MVSGQLQAINDWDAKYVKKAERSWGRKFPKYTKDIFNFALDNGDSWIDLGCGFGRFLKFLLARREEPDYVGYDSSPTMIKRIHELYPDYSIRIFLRNITKHVPPFKDVVVSSAVFIHLNQKDQQQILNNISKMKPTPRAIVFDINSYASKEHPKGYFIEEISIRNFRMTFQDPQPMLRNVKRKFRNYSVSTKKYNLRKGLYKTVFFLKRPSVERFIKPV